MPNQNTNTNKKDNKNELTVPLRIPALRSSSYDANQRPVLNIPLLARSQDNEKKEKANNENQPGNVNQFNIPLLQRFNESRKALKTTAGVTAGLKELNLEENDNNKSNNAMTIESERLKPIDLSSIIIKRDGTGAGAGAGHSLKRDMKPILAAECLTRQTTAELKYEIQENIRRNYDSIQLQANCQQSTDEPLSGIGRFFATRSLRVEKTKLMREIEASISAKFDDDEQNRTKQN